MALISISFAISLLTYHLLQKLKIYDKLPLWTVLRNLQFYMPPSREELKLAAGIGDMSKNKGNRKHRRVDFSDNEKILIPKGVDVDLRKHDLEVDIASALKFYVELKWLLSVASTAIVAYAITEFYYFAKDKALGVAVNTTRQMETNFSLLWCIVTAFLAVFLLLHIVQIYYSIKDHGELYTVILAGIVGAFFAMAMLVLNDKAFDFGLKDAHRNFTEQLQKIPAITEFARTVNFTLFAFGLFIGTLSGFTTAIVAFPGIRFGKMFRDARDTAAAQEDRIGTLMYTVSFGFPVLLCLLWMPSAKEHFFVDNAYISFETTRILLILLGVIIRFASMRPFIQSHLDIPRKILHALKKEPGRMDVDDFRKSLGFPLRYTCVTVVQYLAPLVMHTMLCFLYTSADLESFFPVRGNSAQSKFLDLLGIPADYATTVFKIHNSVWTLFTGALLKSVFGYLIWWILISHFAFSMFSFFILSNQQ